MGSRRGGDGDDRDGVKKRGSGPYGFPDGRKGAIIERFSFDTFSDKGGPKIFSWDRSGKGGPKIWTFPRRSGFSFEGAPEGLAESLEWAVERGVISREMADRILERIGGVTDEDDSDEES